MRGERRIATVRCAANIHRVGTPWNSPAYRIPRVDTARCGMATKPRPNDTGDPLLTDSEVCNHLRIHQRQLYAWRMRGFIPFIRIGRSIRYRLRDLEAAVDSWPVTGQDAKKTR